MAYSVTPISDDDEKAKSENISFNGKSILSSSYTYDDNGNVLTKSYGDNISVSNTYDSKDRITSTTFAGKTTNYTYDSNGQLVSTNDDTMLMTAEETSQAKQSQEQLPLSPIQTVVGKTSLFL